MKCDYKVKILNKTNMSDWNFIAHFTAAYAAAILFLWVEFKRSKTSYRNRNSKGSKTNHRKASTQISALQVP